MTLILNTDRTRSRMPTLEEKINADLRDINSPYRHELRSRENLDLWATGLRTYIATIESEMAAKEREAQEIQRRHEEGDMPGSDMRSRLAGIHDWKSRAIKARNYGVTRLVEAEQLVAEHFPERRLQVHALLGAIRLHRDATLGEEIEPGPHDLDLWALV